MIPVLEELDADTATINQYDRRAELRGMTVKTEDDLLRYGRQYECRPNSSTPLRNRCSQKRSADEALGAPASKRARTSVDFDTLMRDLSPEQLVELVMKSLATLPDTMPAEAGTDQGLPPRPEDIKPGTQPCLPYYNMIQMCSYAMADEDAVPLPPAPLTRKPYKFEPQDLGEDDKNEMLLDTLQRLLACESTLTKKNAKLVSLMSDTSDGFPMLKNATCFRRGLGCYPVSSATSEFPPTILS